ncbi:MAG: xanthine dehydrogenase family protein molybdopterin-binding subunit [Firmicutes bacterium]|nr:xanthine dehydrogenase family protein molybdopterin-binding subunit [Bacillota bacterium]
MPDFSVVGRGVTRLDARAKARGETRYLGDMSLPGMLHGKILRSPHPHARIVGIDCRRALSLAGVKAVVTGRDLPPHKYGYLVQDELILARDLVRFAGEEVAAVAAVDEDTAQEALDLIRVEYEVLPAVFEMEDAMAEGAPRIHDVERNIASRVVINRGDVERGFQEAHLVMEDRFTTQSVHQGYLDPVSCITRWEDDGSLTIHGVTQAPFIQREVMAASIGLAPEQIRVIQPAAGGGFGGKLDQKVWVIAAVLARAAGKPVRLILSYEEELTAGRPRVPLVIDLKMGFARDGLIKAKDTGILADNGAYCSYGPGVISVASHRSDSLYRYPAVRCDAKLVYTNKTPTGAYRGFGNPQVHFAVESLIDRAAVELGIDPAEIRLRNAVQKGEVTIHGWVLKSCALDECIKQAMDASAWKEKRSRLGPGRGLGMACMVHVSSNRASYRPFDGASALVKLEGDGGAVLTCGEVDFGQGNFTAYAQMISEELGIRPDQVKVLPPDTSISTFGLGSSGSREIFIGGGAVRLAARDARRQLLNEASVLLGSSPDELEIEGGIVFPRGNREAGRSIAEVAREAVYRGRGLGILGRGTFDPGSELPDAGKYGNISGCYTFACHVAEVEVDPETGAVKVVDYVAAHDLGRAINPAGAEGQIEGGVAQGIGFTLSEELVSREGRILNHGLLDYRIPTPPDLPRIRPILVEEDDPVGPYGAKGLGEPPQNPVPAAIANAVYDAVGVQFRDLPMVPERVAAGLAGRSPKGRPGKGAA